MCLSTASECCSSTKTRQPAITPDVALRKPAFSKQVCPMLMLKSWLHTTTFRLLLRMYSEVCVSYTPSSDSVRRTLVSLHGLCGADQKTIKINWWRGFINTLTRPYCTYPNLHLCKIIKATLFQIMTSVFPWYKAAAHCRLKPALMNPGQRWLLANTRDCESDEGIPCHDHTGQYRWTDTWAIWTAEIWTLHVRVCQFWKRRSAKTVEAHAGSAGATDHKNVEWVCGGQSCPPPCFVQQRWEWESMLGLAHGTSTGGCFIKVLGLQWSRVPLRSACGLFLMPWVKRCQEKDDNYVAATCVCTHIHSCQHASEHFLALFEQRYRNLTPCYTFSVNSEHIYTHISSNT